MLGGDEELDGGPLLAPVQRQLVRLDALDERDGERVHLEVKGFKLQEGRLGLLAPSESLSVPLGPELPILPREGWEAMVSQHWLGIDPGTPQS